MDKVELKFVVDIVGHDEQTILQMYNDWLGSPFNYRNNNSSQLEAQVSEILADFENLLIEIMSNRKCSIGSIDNYYDLHLEVKKINELYSKLQYYHIVSQKSR